jgi:hypothetical protein
LTVDLYAILATASDFVVTITGIDGGAYQKDAVAFLGNTNDYVVTILSIDGTLIMNTSIRNDEMILVTNTNNYVVTSTSIYSTRAGGVTKRLRI